MKYCLPFLLISLCLFIHACATKKELVYDANSELSREVLLDSLVISDVAALQDTVTKMYKAAATLSFDIQHTKLDLRFDWAKQYVIGTAEISGTPYFKPLTSITLDAVGFEIQQVLLVPTAKSLDYRYNGSKLDITLDRSYQKSENITLLIEYIAKPNENQVSGGEAITSDKGLFFIDPLGNDPDLPTQIWTQGETENNSKWFPTFDKPNERFTQEIILTVEDKYQTLSNGIKIDSKRNLDGTRTDHWKQSRPHAPYLAMIAVGVFDEVSDTWNDVPLHYYVEKGFGKHAKKIFNHTPEMLTFFTEKLQCPYPWEKYDQVIVREFVSGAMENTSAVVFGEFVQKTENELIDNDNDYIVAHEMMHHWFGNLVTCEDWSNLTLNEGFANYAEYLWFEHKYGKDRAEYHRINEMNGYFNQIFNGGAHPLIHYYYNDKDEMFDAHSYNKGGLVLHMLRQYVGDEAFFVSLNLYLKKHSYTAVEVDELRLAFEDVTGEDLNWFFDQWFLGTGHPHIDVQYTYNDNNNVLLVEVDQTNTPKGFCSVFSFPVDIAVYYNDGTVDYFPVFIREKKQKILIENLKEKPATYVFDGRNVLLALINENKSNEAYKAQFMLSPQLADKISAFSNTNDRSQTLIDKGLKDPFFVIRSMTIDAIEESQVEAYIAQLEKMAVADVHSQVRLSALQKLLLFKNDNTALCKSILDKEKAYAVIGLALEMIFEKNQENDQFYIDKYKNEDSDYLCAVLARIMQKDTPENLDYLEKKAKTIDMANIFDFYESYQNFLVGKSMSTLERSASFAFDLASNPENSIFRKYLSMVTLNKINAALANKEMYPMNSEKIKLQQKLTDLVSKIMEKESNPILIEKYLEVNKP